MHERWHDVPAALISLCSMHPLLSASQSANSLLYLGPSIARMNGRCRYFLPWRMDSACN